MDQRSDITGNDQKGCGRRDPRDASQPDSATRGKVCNYLDGKVHAPTAHASAALVAQLQSALSAAQRLRNGDVSEGVRTTLKSGLAAIITLSHTDALEACGRRALTSIVAAHRIRLADVLLALRKARERERRPQPTGGLGPL